jgi:inorganic pyrophosphatase
LNLTNKYTVSTGEYAPEEINVVIEIPRGSRIKYELDPVSGLLVVDRILLSAMYYPCNYGFIPQTKEEDGDPIDVLVLGNYPIIPLAIIKARPVGILLTEDEKGQDSKIVAAPLNKVDPSFSTITEVDEIPQYLRNQITHFFEHYKELEKGKFVKVIGWKGAEIAKTHISGAMIKFRSSES